jgi:uncharacterized protein YlxP (DUF503 family)
MSKSKRTSPDIPICFAGRIVFEFFNNDDEDFKVRTLTSLAKEVRKEANVSCTYVEEGQVQNPERGVLAVACIAKSHDHGKSILDKALSYLDGKAPARIQAEDFQEAELP